MTSRSIVGPFSSRVLGNGLWQLSDTIHQGRHIYLWVADSPTGFIPANDVRRVELTWHANSVGIDIVGPTSVARCRATAAIVHEPQPQLYDQLPLAAFDLKAQRFWRRVFRLIRLPGGRFLLGMVARRRG